MTRAAHGLPAPLARRVRSAVCLAGEDDCVDQWCLCTCHGRPAETGWLARVVMGLDRIISETPGSWDGFGVPPPLYPDRPTTLADCPDAMDVSRMGQLPGTEYVCRRLDCGCIGRTDIDTGGLNTGTADYGRTTS